MPFAVWRQKLIVAAGPLSLTITRFGDHILILFWRDGCEPTMEALFEYAQVGLAISYGGITAEQKAQRKKLVEDLRRHVVWTLRDAEQEIRHGAQL